MRQSAVSSYWCLDSTHQSDSVQASDCAQATDAKQLEDNEPEAVLTAGSDHSKDDQIFIDYEPLAAHLGLGKVLLRSLTYRPRAVFDYHHMS